ncbi:hypothetical protein BASA50_010135 [Batrachochytrium salamandrivorans]|uniref:GPI inositol-deacylase n=1 Tax=Batrachochytrium salamandrivorans TaxID=1357716 RepID=A0ABQ8EZ88_9FUNG|nr:hypothetical protein BASA50_010135 [Batrachochytrium salamandrivorans]
MILAAFSFLKYRIDPKACDGNYIRPAYIRQNSFHFSLSQRNPDYALYLHREYGESVNADDLNEDTMLNGIPVLFIPGHAGDYTQAKTLGAAAMRVLMWKRAEGTAGHPLDLFTMDTNRELAAFTDAALLLQAHYASEAIKYILDRYKHMENGPTSVHVIGHSMGGVVSRLIPLLPELLGDGPGGLTTYAPIGSIKSIITIASPHNHPPAPLSYRMNALYKRVGRMWLHGVESLRLEEITVVSIATGRKDLVLNSALTHLDGVMHPDRALSVYATAVPGVWATMDHEGAVWCNQLIEKVIEAIYDVHDPVQPRQLLPVKTRFKAMQRIFLGRLRFLDDESAIVQRPDLINSRMSVVNTSYLSIPDISHIGVHNPIYKIDTRSNLQPNRYLRILTSSCIVEPPNTMQDTSNTNRQIGIFAQVGYLPSGSNQRYYDLRKWAARLVPASATTPFQIMFRHTFNGRESGRPCWTLIEVDMHHFFNTTDRMNNVLIEMKEQTTGFIEASLDDLPRAHVVPVSTLGLIFGMHTVLETSGVVSHFEFPRIRDSHLKYHVQLVPICVGAQTFHPFVEYGVPQLQDAKFVTNIVDFILSWYSDPSGDRRQIGVQMTLYSPLSCTRADLRVKIHWLASLGALVGDYISFLPAMLVASGVLYSTAFYDSSSDTDGALTFKKIIDRKFDSFLKILFIVDLAYPYIVIAGGLPVGLFLGPRDIANPFGLHFWFSVSTGIIYTAHLLLVGAVWCLGYLLGCASKLFGHPMLSKAELPFTIIVGVVSVLVLPWHSVQIGVFLYLLLQASYHSYLGSSQDDMNSSHMVLLLSALLIPFSVPPLLAMGVFRSPGHCIRPDGWLDWISCSSLSDLVGVLLQLVFASGYMLQLRPIWETRRATTEAYGGRALHRTSRRNAAAEIAAYILAGICIVYGMRWPCRGISRTTGSGSRTTASISEDHSTISDRIYHHPVMDLHTKENLIRPWLMPFLCSQLRSIQGATLDTCYSRQQSLVGCSLLEAASSTYVDAIGSNRAQSGHGNGISCPADRGMILREMDALHVLEQLHQHMEWTVGRSMGQIAKVTSCPTADNPNADHRLIFSDSAISIHATLSSNAIQKESEERGINFLSEARGAIVALCRYKLQFQICKSEVRPFILVDDWTTMGSEGSPEMFSTIFPKEHSDIRALLDTIYQKIIYVHNTASPQYEQGLSVNPVVTKSVEIDADLVFQKSITPQIGNKIKDVVDIAHCQEKMPIRADGDAQDVEESIAPDDQEASDLECELLLQELGAISSFSPSTNTIYELSDASQLSSYSLSRRRASEANPLDILPPSQPFIPCLFELTDADLAIPLDQGALLDAIEPINSPVPICQQVLLFSLGDARKVAGSSYQSAASTSIYDMSDSDNDEGSGESCCSLSEKRSTIIQNPPSSASTDASLNTVHPEETTMPLHQESRDPSGPIHSPLYDNRPRSPSQPSLRTAAFIPPELLSQFDSQADVFYRSEIGNNPLFQHRIINLSAPEGKNESQGTCLLQSQEEWAASSTDNDDTWEQSNNSVLAPSRDISNADIATESTVDLSHTSISAPNLFVRTDQETTTAKSPIALKTNDDNGLTEDDDDDAGFTLEDVIIDAEDDISVCDIDNVIPAHLELLSQKPPLNQVPFDKGVESMGSKQHISHILPHGQISDTRSAFSQSPQANSVSSNHDQVDYEGLISQSSPECPAALGCEVTPINCEINELSQQSLERYASGDVFSSTQYDIDLKRYDSSFSICDSQNHIPLHMPTMDEEQLSQIDYMHCSDTSQASNSITHGHVQSNSFHSPVDEHQDSLSDMYLVSTPTPPPTIEIATERTKSEVLDLYTRASGEMSDGNEMDIVLENRTHMPRSPVSKVVLSDMNPKTISIPSDDSVHTPSIPVDSQTNSSNETCLDHSQTFQARVKHTERTCKMAHHFNQHYRSSTTDRLHSQTSSAIAARNGILIDDANIMDSTPIPTLQPCNIPDKCKGDALEMECQFLVASGMGHPQIVSPPPATLISRRTRQSPSIFSKRTQPSSQDLSTDTSMNILQSKAKKVGSSGGHTPNAALVNLTVSNQTPPFQKTQEIPITQTSDCLPNYTASSRRGHFVGRLNDDNEHIMDILALHDDDDDPSFPYTETKESNDELTSSVHSSDRLQLTLDNAILATATDAYSSDAETDQFDKRDMYDFPELDEANSLKTRHIGTMKVMSPTRPTHPTKKWQPKNDLHKMSEMVSDATVEPFIISSDSVQNEDSSDTSDCQVLSEDPFLHRQPPKALIAPKNKIAVVCLPLHSSQGSTCEKSTDSKDTFESDRVVHERLISPKKLKRASPPATFLPEPPKEKSLSQLQRSDGVIKPRAFKSPKTATMLAWQPSSSMAITRTPKPFDCSKLIPASGMPKFKVSSTSLAEHPVLGSISSLEKLRNGRRMSGGTSIRDQLAKRYATSPPETPPVTRSYPISVPLKLPQKTPATPTVCAVGSEGTPRKSWSIKKDTNRTDTSHSGMMPARSQRVHSSPIESLGKHGDRSSVRTTALKKTPAATRASLRIEEATLYSDATAPGVTGGRQRKGLISDMDRESDMQIMPDFIPTTRGSQRSGPSLDYSPQVKKSKRRLSSTDHSLLVADRSCSLRQTKIRKRGRPSKASQVK